MRAFLFLIGISVVLTGCGLSSGGGQSTTAPAAAVVANVCPGGTNFDVTVSARSGSQLNDPVFFDQLNNLPLSQVQLEKETFTIRAFVFDLDDVDASHLKLSLNGSKGVALGSDAVEVHKISDNEMPPTNISGLFDHVEILFHLERYLFGVNKTAADLLRESSAGSGTSKFGISHLLGVYNSSSGRLILHGEYPPHCPPPTPTPSPTPTATPSPTASPTPTPVPTPTPTPPPPPVVTIDSTSVGILTNSPNITVTFHANEAATFLCSLDASAFQSCQSPFSQAAITDGLHHFSVEAVDSLGEVGAPAQFDWTIDTTPPVITLGTITPPDPETAQTQITINFSANETATFECMLDGSNWAVCSSPVSYNGLVDGGHTFGVRATDLAGNVTPFPTTYSWVVKTTPPTVIINQVVPPNSPSNSTSRSFSFFGSTDSVRFTCALDTQAEAACVSPAQLTGLADGGHTFSIWAFDAAGNRSAPAISSFTIDTVVPTVSITGTVPIQNPTNQTTIQISFAASKSATFTCSLDGSVGAACISPLILSNLADGTHEVQVVATDAAGNISSTPAEYSWTVDTVAPALTLVSANPSQPIFNQTLFTLSFSSTKPTQAACQLDTQPALDCSSGSVNFTSLTDGAHTVTVVATDAAGNVSQPLTYNFTVDTTKPVVQITSTNPSQPLTNQMSMTVTFSANKTATFTCQIDSTAAAPCASPQTYSALADGQHTITIVGMDDAGNISAQPATYTWTIDTQAPVTQILSEVPNVTPTNSQTISFTFTADKASTFDCELDGGGITSCTSPTTFNGLADGVHIFAVHATSTAGTRDATGATYTWTVITNALTISGFRVDGVTQTSAVVSWTTSEPSTTQVFYELSTDTTFSSTPIDNTLVTTHSVTLSGLADFGLYTVFGTSTGDSQQVSSSQVSFRTLR